MKRSFIAAVTFLLSLGLHAQATMNLNYSNGMIESLFMNEVDSVVYQTANDPFYMSIHLSNGSTLQKYLADVDSLTYSENGDVGAHLVVTLPPSGISDTSVQISGWYSSYGTTGDIISHGVVWGDQPSPTTSDDMVLVDLTMGRFHTLITGLSNNTTYYARAYTTDLVGTSYGNQVSFTTYDPVPIISSPGAGVVDLDGNVYATLILNNGQEWMLENLRTSTYANGDPIENITANEDWEQSTSGGWSYYENDPANGDPYGMLYNGYAVTDPRNVCPTDWHVPTYQEVLALMDHLGGSLVAGNKMKDPSGWWGDMGATNESGFSALPGGLRQTGIFMTLEQAGYWWCSTEIEYFEYMWRFRLLANVTETNSGYVPKSNGNSIRCVKD